jgi:paraquat-inducible protein A
VSFGAGTAAAAGLASCHACGELTSVRAAPIEEQQGCPRCGAALHLRKPNSLTRTWALVIAAFLLYIPANVYPVLIVDRLGRQESDTILSGVQELFAAGMVPIALLVFFASITVPLLKLLGLSFLMLSVQFRWFGSPRTRTLLYRLIESIGRWSMIDMFMVSILVALVKLGQVATILPGIGATAFAAVVVTTMFAASAFDPRLIWDALEEKR